MKKKTVACRDFFNALELCHANVWAKWTGGCNQAKRDLNKCLHKEAIPFSTFASLTLCLFSLMCSLWHVQRGTGKMQRCGMHGEKKPFKNYMKMTRRLVLEMHATRLTSAVLRIAVSLHQQPGFVNMKSDTTDC